MTIIHFRNAAGQPASAGDPISLSQAEAALNKIDGDVTVATIRLAGQTATPSLGAIVADVHLLRVYGAKLDGITDDLAAFQGIVNDARSRTPAIILVPTVLFELSGSTALLSGPISTGTCNVSFRGAAPNVCTMVMASGGAGLIQHGTAATPAVGYLHLQGLSLVDGNPTGTGSAGVSMQFTGSATQPCLTMKDVCLRLWTRPVEMTDAPRGVRVENVTVFGPGPGFQAAPGFKVTSTTGSGLGCFSYDWSSVLVANYRNGWEFLAASGWLEGMVFVGCRAYNGWGFVQVRNTVGGGYQSLMWEFTSCDWQGYGFALDLQGCRQVRVRGGYWIATTNPGGLPLVGGNTRRRYFTLKGCSDVIYEAVKVDVLPGQDSGLSLFHADAACADISYVGTKVASYSTLYAGFENEANANANQVSERDTRWLNWQGGPRVLDAGNNQAWQSLVRGENAPGDGRGYYGDVDSQGRYDLRYRTGTLTTDSNGRVTILYPARPGGSPFFIGGAPSVQALVENAGAPITQPSIYALSSTGVTMQFPAGTAAGLAVAFDVSVGGL